MRSAPVAVGLRDRSQADHLEVLVVPSSLLPVESSNKVKTDRRDSRKLGSLLPPAFGQMALKIAILMNGPALMAELLVKPGV